LPQSTNDVRLKDRPGAIQSSRNPCVASKRASDRQRIAQQEQQDPSPRFGIVNMARADAWPPPPPPGASATPRRGGTEAPSTPRGTKKPKTETQPNGTPRRKGEAFEIVASGRKTSERSRSSCSTRASSQRDSRSRGPSEMPLQVSQDRAIPFTAGLSSDKLKYSAKNVFGTRKGCGWHERWKEAPQIDAKEIQLQPVRMDNLEMAEWQSKRRLELGAAADAAGRPTDQLTADDPIYFWAKDPTQTSKKCGQKLGIGKMVTLEHKEALRQRTPSIVREEATDGAFKKNPVYFWSKPRAHKMKGISAFCEELWDRSNFAEGGVVQSLEREPRPQYVMASTDMHVPMRSRYHELRDSNEQLKSAVPTQQDTSTNSPRTSTRCDSLCETALSQPAGLRSVRGESPRFWVRPTKRLANEVYEVELENVQCQRPNTSREEKCYKSEVTSSRRARSEEPHPSSGVWQRHGRPLDKAAWRFDAADSTYGQTSRAIGEAVWRPSRRNLDDTSGRSSGCSSTPRPAYLMESSYLSENREAPVFGKESSPGWTTSYGERLGTHTRCAPSLSHASSASWRRPLQQDKDAAGMTTRHQHLQATCPPVENHSPTSFAEAASELGGYSGRAFRSRGKSSAAAASVNSKPKSRGNQIAPGSSGKQQTKGMTSRCSSCPSMTTASRCSTSSLTTSMKAARRAKNEKSERR